MENKKENLKVSMVSATAQAIQTPVFKIANNKEYILYGEKNDYPTILKEMMNQSSLHNAILKKKTDMTAGKGFKYDLPQQKTFIANINGSETLDQIVYKNAYDLVLYGGFSYLVTWSKDKSKIARIQFIDFSKVRKMKELDDDSEIAQRQAEGIEYFLISSDWTQERKEKYKPRIIQGFSTEYKDEATQLVYVPMYRPGCDDFYPLADYQSCATYIALDIEISSFHLNSIKNGFSPSFIMSLVGVPTDEEMKQFEKRISEQYAGSANASKVILTISEDESQIPQITPINLNDSDKRYEILSDIVKEQIIIGHRASNAVVGVATAGKLNSSQEVIEAEMMFQHNVIDNYQILIENSYNRIMNFNGIEGEITLEKSTTFDVDGVKENNDNKDATE